jgi:uncharacterized protein GlcG (DUF336 family)
VSKEHHVPTLSFIPYRRHEDPHLYSGQTRCREQGRGDRRSRCQGELLAFLRTDGCKLPSITIAINKAYTAAREKNESFFVGEASRTEGFPMTNFGELRYTTWGGGVPILHAGEVVGAVGVSGLPEAEDMALAREAAQLFTSLS